MPPSAVINYHLNFSTKRERLMGANAAAEAFFRAYLRHSGDPLLHVIVHSEQEMAAVREEARQFAPKADLPIRFYNQHASAEYGPVGCVYNEDPLFSHFAWMRRWDSVTAYSLCGITHTTCTAEVLDAFGALVTAPLYHWDALICTSQSVRNTVDRVLERYSAYLAERLGASQRPAVELPVIPLGVDCDRFDRGAQGLQERQAWRAQLGIAEQDIAFLFFGRLSYHGKANPFPMLRALEIATQQSGVKLHLILAGWFANETLEARITEAAARFAPSVQLHKLDGRRDDVRTTIWTAADIFTSLSDNVQETFGLTPVEAMAAGLPAVISDWDGYRDTVRHGRDGLRVPTSMAPAGTGEVLMRRHYLQVDNYDRYIGHVSHFNAVDLASTVEAYLALIRNPALRREMGASGRQRAREVFDWRVIIGKYQELWSELARRRQAAAQGALSSLPAHPLRPDPYELFGDYPTAPLAADTLVGLSPLMDPAVLPLLYEEPILQYLSTPALMASLDELQRLLATCAQGPQLVRALLQPLPPDRHEATLRGIMWLLKTGLLQRKFPTA